MKLGQAPVLFCSAATFYSPYEIILFIGVASGKLTWCFSWERWHIPGVPNVLLPLFLSSWKWPFLGVVPLGFSRFLVAFPDSFRFFQIPSGFSRFLMGFPGSFMLFQAGMPRQKSLWMNYSAQIMLEVHGCRAAAWPNSPSSSYKWCEKSNRKLW